MLLIGTEITAHKRAAEALRKSELRLAEAQRMAQIGNWEWDFVLGDIFWSEEMYRLLGYDPRDLGRPTLDTFFERTHPEDRFRLDEAIDATISEGQPLKQEYRVLLPDGGERHLFVNAKLERDRQGRPIRLVGTAQNITEREMMERDRANLEAQLHHVQKMETLGTMAGGIAHDFNNILTPILGFTEMAMENAPEGSMIRDDLSQALKAAHRARDLVQQMLVFSRNVEHERRPIQISLVIKEAVKMIRAGLPSTIEIQVIDRDQHCLVNADPTQIHQVLMNLCTNAYHAMRDQVGRLDIVLEPVSVDEQLRRAHPNFAKGRYLRISVRDTGHGMDETVLPRMFEPFFTTKRVGDGTGLGLAVVHGIVAGHDGVIRVESEVGVGTNFHLYLPIVKDGAPEVFQAEEVVIPGRERILFVDDESIIVEMCREMLTRLGYQVTSFCDSREALAHFRENTWDFDLVITDQTMPNLTGIQLAVAIMELRPAIPVILISGYSETVSPEDSKRAGIRAYLSKPILTGDLNKVMRRILDGVP